MQALPSLECVCLDKPRVKTTSIIPSLLFLILIMSVIMMPRSCLFEGGRAYYFQTHMETGSTKLSQNKEKKGNYKQNYNQLKQKYNQLKLKYNQLKLKQKEQEKQIANPAAPASALALPSIHNARLTPRPILRRYLIAIVGFVGGVLIAWGAYVGLNCHIDFYSTALYESKEFIEFLHKIFHEVTAFLMNLIISLKQTSI